MDSISGRDDDTPQPEAPSPPDITSKSSQSKAKLTDSGPRRASSRPTLQGRPSYATIARNAPSDERLDGAAGANPATASGQPSRRREPLPTDDQTTAISGTTLRGRQAITERRDASQFDNEFDGRSRAGQLQPPPDADNTQSASVYSTSPPKLPNISASKEARAAQREGGTTPGPIASAGSMQLSSQLPPVTNSPPSRNVLPSRVLQDTGSNVSLEAPGLEETRKRNESPPFAQVDPPRERTVIRSHAEQLDRTASVQPSVKPFTSSPSAFSSRDRNVIRPHAGPVDRTASIRQSVKPSTPPLPLPLKRPSASTSPLPSFPAPALVKKASSRMHTPRGMLPYEPQAPPRGTHFDSPHPLGDDGGKARSDEQSRMDPSTPHRPSPPPEHTPATTERPSQQEINLNPSSVPRRPIPLEHNYAMTELSSRQDRKDTSAAQHRPPASLEQTPAATEPFRKDHKDTSATPHRLPTPPEHPPATAELPSRLERKPSSLPHRPSVLSELAHAMTEPPSRQDGKDPTTVQYGPPAPSEHTLAMTEHSRKGHKDASDTPHRPPTPQEQAPTTTEPPSQLKRSPSSVPHVPPEHTHAMTELTPRWDRKDPSATQRGPPAPSEHTFAATEHPRKGHKDTPHILPAPSEHAFATTEPPSRLKRSPSSVPHVPPGHTHAMTELPSRWDRKDPSAVQRGPPAPLEHTPAATEHPRKGPKDTRHIPPTPPEHAPATTEPPQLKRNPSSVPHVPSEHTHAMTELPSQWDRKDPSVNLGASERNDQSARVDIPPQSRDRQGERLRLQPASLDDRHDTVDRQYQRLDNEKTMGPAAGFSSPLLLWCAAWPVPVAATSFNPLGDAKYIVSDSRGGWSEGAILGTEFVQTRTT